MTKLLFFENKKKKNKWLKSKVYHLNVYTFFIEVIFETLCKIVIYFELYYMQK